MPIFGISATVAGAAAVAATEAALVAGATTTAAYGTTYAAVHTASAFVLSGIALNTLGLLPKAPEDTGARVQVAAATNNTLPVVYGYSTLGGTIVDVVPSIDNQTLYYVFAISSRSKNANTVVKFDQRGFYYGDKLVRFQYDATKPTSFNEVVSDLYDNAGVEDDRLVKYQNLKMYLYQSNDAGVISGLNTNLLPSTVMGGNDIPPAQRWPATGRQMNNTIFAIVRVAYNKEYSTSLQPIKFKVYHSPSGASSVLPGDVLYDYLTDNRYGCAIDPSQVDSTIITALNDYGSNLAKAINYTAEAGPFPLGSTKTAKSGVSQITTLGTYTSAVDRVNNKLAFTAGSSLTGYAVGDLVGRVNLDGPVTTLGKVSAVDAVNKVLTFETSVPAWKIAMDGDVLTAYTSAQQAYRWQPCGVLDTGRTCLENLNHIVTSIDCWLTFNNPKGKWSAIINDAWTGPVYDFNDTNIIGGIQVSSLNLSGTPNTVEVSFPNGLNQDKPDYYTATLPATLRNPNEPVNKLSTNFSLISDSVRAQYLGNRYLFQGREDLIVSLNADHSSLQVDAGDVVSITSTVYPWTAKLFRVIKSNQVVLADGTLGCSFELNEYNAQIYTNPTINEFRPAPNAGNNDVTFFGGLMKPTVAAVSSTATIPSLNVTVTIPSTGIANKVNLYLSLDGGNTWTQVASQEPITGSAFTPGSTVTILQTGIPTTTTLVYAFKIVGPTGTSGQSPSSDPFNWSPSVTSNASSLSLDYSPDFYIVPVAAGMTTVTGLGTTYPFSLSVLNGATAVNVSTATTDAGQAANSWRITSTTNTNVTVTANTPTGTTATFNLTAASALSGSYTVNIRYKAADGTTYTNLSQQFNVTLVQAGSTTKSVDISGSGAFQYNPTNTTYSPATLSLTAQPQNLSGSQTYLWSVTGGTLSSTTAATTTLTPTSTTSVSITLTATDGGTNYQRTITLPVISNGTVGPGGRINGKAYVYQWAASQPSAPTGSSTYTYSSNSNDYSNLDSWRATVPSNPGTSGLYLYSATVSFDDAYGTTTRSITATASTPAWSGASISNISANGALGPTGPQGPGAKFQLYKMYQVANPGSAPSGPTGTYTYTWSTGATNATFPINGWTATIPADVKGQTTWAAIVSVTAATSDTTTSINFATAAIIADHYTPIDGTSGSGTSARQAYARIGSNPVPTAGSVTVTGDARPTGAQAGAVWGSAFNTTWSAGDPDTASNNSLYVTDGAYNSATGQTIWSAPYIAYFKVGTLSALNVNTGSLNVTGTITVFGNATNGMTIDGTNGITIWNSGVARVKLGNV